MVRAEHVDQLPLLAEVFLKLLKLPTTPVRMVPIAIIAR